MTQLPFESWAVLEVMGHRRLTGLVREVTLAGAGFLRIDVFEGSDCEAKATQYYPPSSVYCLTPTTEEAAREAAKPWAPPALTERREPSACYRCGKGILGCDCLDEVEWCDHCGEARAACDCE